MEAIIHHKKASTNTFPGWLTILRILLGLVLMAKGISFFYDSTSLESAVQNKGWELFSNNAQVVSAIITYVHLLGGLFIATGLFTRLASVIQIPILIGAVIFNVNEGISFSNTELLLSGLSLLLLIVFVFKGGGNLSADEFFKSYMYAGTEKGHTRKFFQ